MLEKVAQKYKLSSSFIHGRLDEAANQFKGVLSQNIAIKIMGK